jgi:hypothetical protein
MGTASQARPPAAEIHAAAKENLFTTRMNHETRAIHAIVIPAVCATVDESSMPD